MERFSKATLTKELQASILGIQKYYGFDPPNGTAQIEPLAKYLSKPLQDVAEAYGAYMALARVAEDYNLPVFKLTGEFTKTSYGRGLIHYKWTPKGDF